MQRYQHYTLLAVLTGTLWLMAVPLETAAGDQDRPLPRMAQIDHSVPSATSQTNLDLSDAKRKKLFKRLHAIKAKQLTELLGLTPEKNEHFLDQLRVIDKGRGSFFRGRRIITRQLKEMLKDPASPAGPLEELLSRFEQLQETFHRASNEEWALIKRELTPHQQAQYLLFRQKFRSMIREKIREAKKQQEQEQP